MPVEHALMYLIFALVAIWMIVDGILEHVRSKGDEIRQQDHHLGGARVTLDQDTLAHVVSCPLQICKCELCTEIYSGVPPLPEPAEFDTDEA